MLEQQVALAQTLNQIGTLSTPVTVAVPGPANRQAPIVISYQDLQTQLEAIAADQP